MQIFSVITTVII